MVLDLIYAHLPCPFCNQKQFALKAWVTPCDYDEDGHWHDAEISLLDCPSCGAGEPETREQGAAMVKIEDALINLWWERIGLVEIGTIYEYWEDFEYQEDFNV